MRWHSETSPERKRYAFSGTRSKRQDSFDMAMSDLAISRTILKGEDGGGKKQHDDWAWTGM
jgi:hypothetical protein